MISTKKSIQEQAYRLWSAGRRPLVLVLLSAFLGLTQLTALAPFSALPAAASAKTETERVELLPANEAIAGNDSLNTFDQLPLSLPADCNPTGGKGGLAPGSYQTKVGGLNATVIVGKAYNPQNPTYLSFYIHGNDGNYTKFQKSNNQINQFVNQHNWIFVAPQSPKGSSWSNNWDESVNTAFAGVLNVMFAKYNVCRNIVIGSAVSGGSIFWTAQFFPNRGGEYQAHISLLCGGLTGKKKAEKVRLLAQKPEVVARSTFDFIYGTNDYLLPKIEQSISIYTNAGFRVQKQVLQGAGHCDQWYQSGLPNTSERIVSDWQARIQELGLE